MIKMRFLNCQTLEKKKKVYKKKKKSPRVKDSQIGHKSVMIY